jgi:hypothetical protein
MTHNLRKYVQQTNIRLIAGGLILLFFVGDGLIYFIYGPGAALIGFFCLLGGMIPVGLVILIMMLMDWITKRANPD